MSDYSVEDIIRAKRVARENGYTVDLPKDEVEQAMNIAQAAGYTVKEAPAVSAKPVPPKTETPPARTAPSVYDVAAKYL